MMKMTCVFKFGIGLGACIFNSSIAAAEADQILVQTDSDTVSVYDASDGRLDCVLPGKLASASGSLLLKEGSGTAVYNEKYGKYQIYLSGESELQPEKYTHLYFLSDTLYTDGDILMGIPGHLYALPGTKLSEKQECFQRVGDFVYTEDRIYDLDGQMLASHPEICVIQEFQDGVLGYNAENGTYTMFDCVDLTSLWTMDHVSYQNSTGETISWITENGEGLVTDLMLTEQINEADWKNQNADRDVIGSGLALICGNEQTGDTILRLNTGEGMNYYHCSNQFTIIEELPGTQMVFCSKNGQTIPMLWSFSDERTFSFENLWTNEIVSIPMDFDSSEITDVVITGVSDLYGVTITTINPSKMTGVLISNGEIMSGPTENILHEAVIAVDEETIKVYENGFSSMNVLFFDKNGGPLSDRNNEVVYADSNMTCMNEGDCLSIIPRK